jgi:hypothetical protein
MVEPFPRIDLKKERRTDEDGNPAIQLFGRRFFADQTVPELLVELLLVASASKKIGESYFDETDLFPSLAALRRDWSDGAHLEYAAKARLNLKLFAFLGASKLETRHETHRRHYRELLQRFQTEERLMVPGGTDKLDVLRTLENLFLGFQGVGGQRTWCAQSFIPINPEMIAGESIWKHTQARRNGADTWEAALGNFAQSQQLFLARGGELLFLQLCNALRQDPLIIRDWFENGAFSLSEQEKNPETLHPVLIQALQAALHACPETVGKLAKFIDGAVDSETAKQTDLDTQRTGPRFTKCGWCPVESWPEGYLFAVELLRICQAELDPIDRFELLEMACAMQVLRSLCAQSVRYVDWMQGVSNLAGPFGYVWAVSDPEGHDATIKRISYRCVKTNERMIHDAIRHPEILKVVKSQRERDQNAGKPWKHEMFPYNGPNGADSRYGHKLFLGLAKRIGLIVPKRGPGARFVLNERLLRYLVMAIIRPGERVTYDNFKSLVFAHYGIALDDRRLGFACEWSGTTRLTTLGGDADRWVMHMLEASGMLRRLSDACSLVLNPFDGAY